MARESSHAAPSDLAAEAARAALADAGSSVLAKAIDTIAHVRLFADSSPLWPCEFGSSNNPPESVARRIGAPPGARYYSESGGDQPVSLLLEWAEKVSRGESELVLLVGAEAIRNYRDALRNGDHFDWNEIFEGGEISLHDRGIGKDVAKETEQRHGLIAPVHFYSLIEQARCNRATPDALEEYRTTMAELCAGFSSVASENPYSQFPERLTSEQILAAEPLTHLYSKRMVARDAVNQGAAVLLTTCQKALELGVDQADMVFPLSGARGVDVCLSQRPEPARSQVASEVVSTSLARASLGSGDIDLMDIYSCFPCAVSAITDQFAQPSPAAVVPTVTGGLPFFGGPGNNYSMHAIASMTSRLRGRSGRVGLVYANGGVMSKHAAVVLTGDPARAAASATPEFAEISPGSAVPLVEQSEGGVVLAHTVRFKQGKPVQATVLAETADRRRFLATTPRGDARTINYMLNSNPAGQRVMIERDATAGKNLIGGWVPA
ncbi:hypothetical protein [Pseudohaliea sp.]|uniref:hypothetical protein n=1 Tax=Pseudohaliea sp. TaxID=2740289 RepID=UPI0032F08EC9